MGRGDGTNMPRRREGEGIPGRTLGFSPFQRFFDDFFRGMPDLLSGLPMMPSLNEETGFMPRANVSENDREVRINVELPGMSEDDVDVTMTSDGIIIRGEKREERREGEERNRHYVEFSYGRFERFIPLNSEIEEDRIEAIFDKGILRIVLPKSEAAQKVSKKIAIQKGTNGSKKGDIETTKS